MQTYNLAPKELHKQSKDKEVSGIDPQFKYEKFGIEAIEPGEIIKDAEQLLNEEKANGQSATSSQEITGEYLLNLKSEKIDTLVDPIFPRVGCICLAGGSDIGKSSLLRQLAINCVTGNSSFLNLPLNPIHHNAIFVSTEDDEHATSFLLTKQTNGYNASQLSKLRFIFDTTNLLFELKQRLTNQPADLVIIDCFADAYGGDLKDTQKIRTFLHQYQQLATEHQCLIVFLHHTAKRTENYEPSKNNLLSGQGFEAKMRMVIELRADILNQNVRHLCIVKGNYLPKSYKQESFVLNFSEDTFSFINTGERIPFEFLVKQQEDSGKAKYEIAKAMHDKGYSYEQIMPHIGYNSKGSVSKLFEKAEKNGWNK